MNVGESGCGRSTFIQTLFSTTPEFNIDEANPTSSMVSLTTQGLQQLSLSNMAPHSPYASVPNDALNRVLTGQLTGKELLHVVAETKLLDNESNTRLERYEVEFYEKSFPVRLSITDVSGFGNAVNHNKSWQILLDYIDSKFEQYLNQETNPNRPSPMMLQDERIHACVYFIPATKTKPNLFDIITMKKLGEKVNLIPIISKADILSASELREMKKSILEELSKHHICSYKLSLPETCSDIQSDGIVSFDDEQRERYAQIRNAIPFAIVGATHELPSPDGRKIKGRLYPWGKLEYEDESLTDLPKLRCLLIRTHMYDLLRKTNDCFFENYRKRILEERLLNHPLSDLSSYVFLPTKQSIESKYEISIRQLYEHHQKELQQDEARLKQLEDKYAEKFESKEKELEELRKRISSLENELGQSIKYNSHTSHEEYERQRVSIY